MPANATLPSRSRSALKRLPLILITLLAAVLMWACETTVEDVREWENAKGANEKMKEFILDEDSSLDVQTEATMILVRRNAASNIEAIFAELDADDRARVTAEVVPQLESMIEKMVSADDQAAGVKAKDGAYYLARTEPSEEMRERLEQIMLTWIDGDNYYRPSASAGLAYQDMVLQALGPKGVPVLEHAIEDKFQKLADAQTDEFRNEMSGKILGIVRQAEELNLPGHDQMVAELFVRRADKLYPDLHEVFDIPFEKNKSDALTPLAEKIVVDPTYTNDQLNARKSFVVNEYYARVKPKEGVRVCAQVVREDRSGFMRWMCARTLLKTAGGNGVDHVMLGLPDDPAAHALPEDHPLADQFDRDTYFFYEAGAFCRSVDALTGDPQLDKFRKYLESNRAVERLVAAECLSYHGNAKDIAALAALEDTTDISAWNPPIDKPEGAEGQDAPEGADAAPTTFSAFAAQVAGKHDERKAELASMRQ